MDMSLKKAGLDHSVTWDDPEDAADAQFLRECAEEVREIESAYPFRVGVSEDVTDDDDIEGVGLASAALEWLEENVEGEWFFLVDQQASAEFVAAGDHGCLRPFAVRFKSQDDAFAFRLRWA